MLRLEQDSVYELCVWKDSDGTPWGVIGYRTLPDGVIDVGCVLSAKGAPPRTAKAMLLELESVLTGRTYLLRCGTKVPAMRRALMSAGWYEVCEGTFEKRLTQTPDLLG